MMGSAKMARTMSGALATCWLTVAPAAWAQEQPATQDTSAEAQPPAEQASDDQGSETDIVSASTITVLVEGRAVVSNGHRSWVDGGLGKTRFDGTASGDYKSRPPGSATRSTTST
jgi:hypothetical protein